MFSRIKVGLLAGIIAVSVIPMHVVAANKFSDVSSNHWASSYISTLAEKNILKGYDDGTFQPDKTISRAELATILVRISGKQVTGAQISTFTDVAKEAWYAGNVEAAKEYLEGTSRNGKQIFYPERAASREEITTAIVKMLGYKASQANMTYSDKFSDKNEISGQYRGYVAIAVEKGIIDGYKDNTFKPLVSVSRAEAAIIIIRALGSNIPNYIDKEEPVESNSMLSKFAGYWYDELSHTYWDFQKIDDKTLKITACGEGGTGTGKATVTELSTEKINMMVKSDIGSIRRTLTFNDLGELILDNKIHLKQSTLEEYEQYAASYQPIDDIQDLRDVEGFYGSWMPVGGGEGGRVYIEFRNRLGGVIEFQSEGERSSYAFNILFADGELMNVETYVYDTGDKGSIIKMKLDANGYLLLSYDNGLMESYERND